MSHDCPWPIEALLAGSDFSLTNHIDVREGDRAVVVSELYYSSAPYFGKGTRTFGYLARPRDIAGPLPAMLLIHGGGGTADPYWARSWSRHGYAALAIDLYGQGPASRKLPDGGPDWSNDFASFRTTDGLENTWLYHVVASCVRAVSVLSAIPEIDANRIGVTGVSWGGYFCCTVMSLDDRLRLGIPVYGAGFNPRVAAGWPQREADGRILRDTFDPGNFLPRCHKPVLWITTTGDRQPFNEVQLSARATPGPNTLCVTVSPGHTEPNAISLVDRPEQIWFADSILRGGEPLPKIRTPVIDGKTIRARCEGTIPINFAVMHFTTQLNKPWSERQWVSTRATLEDGGVGADLPEEDVVAFFNVHDKRGALVASEYVEVARSA